jgi:hypothetical protein
MPVSSRTKKSRIAALALAAFALLLFSGCQEASALVGQVIARKPTAEADGRVVDKVAGVSIVPPAGWTFEKSAPPIYLMYMGPAKNNYRTNMNVCLGSDEGETFEQVSKQIREESPKQFKDWVLASQKVVQMNGQDVYRFSAAFRVSPIIVLRNVQYVMRGGKEGSCVLTFTTLIEEFDKLEKQFDATAATLRFE